MINEENLNKLYNGVLEGAKLTTQELTSYGFTSKDLKELIEKGTIERLARGFYSLKSVDGLLYYGKYLISQKEYDKANKCFEKCYEINPTHPGTCFQLFLRYIKVRDYQKAFKYLDVFYNSDNKFYNSDSRFYLYLLSMITVLPEKYQKTAKFLTFNDIMADPEDKRYPDTKALNKIRLSSYNQRFTYATGQLNEYIKRKGKLDVQDIVTKSLLIQAADIKKKNRSIVINLIKQKRYEDVVIFYNRILVLHHLNKVDVYTLFLTRELINITRTKIIPPIQVFNTEDYYEAINGKNFELALTLSNARNAKYKDLQENNSINLLLNEIVNKIKELSIKEEPKIIPVETPIIPTPTKAPEVSTFADVTRYLMTGDLDNTFKTLRSYLTSINKIDYEFLIVDLIKISLLEKDTAFTKPMTTLTLISRDNYSFDASTYIQEFYITLSQSKLEEAKIYLDIIEKGNKLGKEQIITENLAKILESSEKSLNQTPTIPEKTKDQKEEVKEEPISKPKEEPKEVLVTKPSVVKIPSKKVEIASEETNSYKEFMDKKHEELVNKKGVILLKPMPSKKINCILTSAKNYQDIGAFVINEGYQQQVVLRYTPIINSYFDVKDIINTGNKAYAEGNNEKCIENYLLLLQIFKEPRSIVYSKLGLAYMRSQQISKAIEYLTIANALAKKENINIDYDNLIAKLKGDIPEDEAKPHFKYNQKINFNDINDYYGLDNFHEINDFILKSGVDIETACEHFGFSKEQIDVTYLIYAREFYKEGNFKQGDLFIKAVEQSENKTSNTIKILTEIRKNKKFYQNREDIIHTELSLTLAPKKK